MAEGDVATTFPRRAWTRATSFGGYWIVTCRVLMRSHAGRDTGSALMSAAT
jgi:hypothetical protein